MNGFATSMTALSDFVASLEATKWFKRPGRNHRQPGDADAKTGDLVKFVVKATYVDPDAPPPTAGRRKPPKKP